MPSVDQKYVPTSFKWSETWGNHVCIAGSFDPPTPTWTPIEMPKNKENVHEISLDLLPDKKYYFKFVIDGNWVLDSNFPSCPDSSGNWNHEIQVELPPPPPPPAVEEVKEEIVINEQLQQEVVLEEEKHQEMTDEQHQEVQIINEDHKEEHHHDHQTVTEDHKIEQQHQEHQVVYEDKDKEEEQEVHHVDENKQHHQEEEQVMGEDKEEQIVEQVAGEDKEEQIVTEEQVVGVDEIKQQHQEEQVVKEQHQEDHQVVAEDHHVDENKQHQEEQVVEEQHQEDHQVVAEDHHVDENKQQHQEEQVVVNEDKEEQHQHQLDHQSVTEEEQVVGVDETKQQHQEEQVVVNEDKEEHYHHQEEYQVVEELHQHQDDQKEHHQEEHQVAEEMQHHHHEKEEHNHQEENQVVEELQQQHEDDQKEQHNEDQIVTEINTIEQSHDDTVVTEAVETETIINETMVEKSELSSIIKETIIESDNAAEHVANIIDDAIIEGTHDESMTTKSDETLHTPQNDTEPINVSISPAVIDENVEEVTPKTTQFIATEISTIEGQNIEDLVNEFKVTEETSSTTGEKYETVVSSTMETEIPIESSSFSTDEINEGKAYEPEHETINENDIDENEEDYDDYENENEYEYENEEAEDSENTVAVVLEENLPEETLKEVLLNNTWAKDDSLEDAIPSSWTESHESQSVIWPDDTNLEWSDINKDETAEIDKPETEFEDNSEHVLEETRVTEITSNDVKEEVLSREIPLTEETITGQIMEEISAQSVVDYETGINNKVPTSEVKESVVVEPSFAQYEKPESSATADLSSIPTTVVAAPAIEQHSHLDEEIDKSKVDDVLKDNISRKIISISPSTLSPGESTRNADIYTHDITVATNTSQSLTKETVNIKSKHKKPVVEITSREILQKDSKIVFQHDEEEEKIDLNDIAYLVTSVATTFTLGIISMLYKSVFGTKNQ